jgi:hypothetical protein
MVFLAETQLPDILQNLPKSWFRGPAHGSISIQEGQPGSTVSSATSGGSGHLRLPRCDLIGVDVEIALQGRKRHLRLEGRCVVSARSSVHGLPGVRSQPITACLDTKASAPGIPAATPPIAGDTRVPDWAKELAGSWPQFFLKYLLAEDRRTTSWCSRPRRRPRGE